MLAVQSLVYPVKKIADMLAVQSLVHPDKRIAGLKLYNTSTSRTGITTTSICGGSRGSNSTVRVL